VIAETALYFGLWFPCPIFGEKLSYFVVTLGFPFQDQLFKTLDAALGFHWMDGARFMAAHPLLQQIHGFAYQSDTWQPALSILIFAMWGPRGRNRELLTSIVLALLATIIISTFLPALGPEDSNGFTTPSGTVVQALRAGNDPGVYEGIICFPSFHTVMAILLTLAHRDIRWSFPFFFMINVVMLTSIPYSGDHYLADMIGGMITAVGAFLVVDGVSHRVVFCHGFWIDWTPRQYDTKLLLSRLARVARKKQRFRW
jgi:hypothetical protein